MLLYNDRLVLNEGLGLIFKLVSVSLGVSIPLSFCALTAGRTNGVSCTKSSFSKPLIKFSGVRGKEPPKSASAVLFSNKGRLSLLIFKDLPFCPKRLKTKIINYIPYCKYYYTICYSQW